jgi:hypothetical protein
VHHLAAPERAQRLADQLVARLPVIRELHVSELGAAIGAHVGPGAVGVVIDPSPRPTTTDSPAQDVRGAAPPRPEGDDGARDSGESGGAGDGGRPGD